MIIGIMTKEGLRSLTIEQLNGMTEEQLGVIANQVIELLEEDKIKTASERSKEQTQNLTGGRFRQLENMDCLNHFRLGHEFDATNHG